MVEQEGPSSVVAAYAELGALHAEFPHPVFDGQAVKGYPDGTTVVINSYNSTEDPEADKEIGTLAVSVFFRDEGATFVITENGLVTFVTGKKRGVSLRSILYPRRGENLRIKYNDPVEESKVRTPRLAYREAAEPLVRWVKSIDSNQQYTPSPISIITKADQATEL